MGSTNEYGDLKMAKAIIVQGDTFGESWGKQNAINIDGELPLGVVLTAAGYKGLTITGTITGTAPAIGSPLYGVASFEYTVADASVIATMPCIALATVAAIGSQTLLLQGQIFNAAWAWVPGPIYVSLTTGELTQTAPSADAEVVQKVGFALSADTMYFNPGAMIELSV